MSRRESLADVSEGIVVCRRCPRLVVWREKVAQEKTRRFRDEEYWGRPVPGFGDPDARLLIVGLAPAAHGANRTGRMFTGDRSGDWLFRALHMSGFASQAESRDRNDRMRLRRCYVTAALRCAPPANMPMRSELQECNPFLLAEIRLLHKVRVVIGLGKTGFDAAVNVFRDAERIAYRRRPAFAHGAVYELDDLIFIASFHPSQQNTFTGRLTRQMFHGIFRKAVRFLDR